MNAKFDILFVSSTLEVGGSETKIVRIANALAQSGYRPAIAYLNPPDSLLERIDPGVPVTCLQRRGKFSVSSLYRLHKLVAGRCRIVAAVNYYPLLYVVPAVRYLRPGYSKAIGLINTTDFVDGQRDWGRIYAPLLRRCDLLIYGCKAQKQLWTKKYSLPRDRSRYIYNGVDSELFSPDADFVRRDGFRSESGIPRDAVVIGSVGRMAPEKNFELLIEALGKLRSSGRDAYLILAGEGRERPELEARAISEGVSDRIIFPGVLRDIRVAIAAMDIFVLPSRAVETFSNAALEAMSMECPVVLTNIGGAAEMVEHEKSGYLFDVGSVGGLTGLLVTLYDSKLLRHQVGHAGRQRVMARFSFAAMLNSYKQLIDSGNPAAIWN